MPKKAFIAISSGRMSFTYFRKNKGKPSRFTIDGCINSAKVSGSSFSCGECPLLTAPTKPLRLRPQGRFRGKCALRENHHIVARNARLAVNDSILARAVASRRLSSAGPAKRVPRRCDRCHESKQKNDRASPEEADRRGRAIFPVIGNKGDRWYES